MPGSSPFAPALTTAAPFARARLPGVAATLTAGRRTAPQLLRTAAGLTEGGPCSLGLYSAAALLYWLLPPGGQGAVEWQGKATATFPDAGTAVRRRLGTRWVFPRAGHGQPFAKLPEASQQFLRAALAPAA